MTVDRVVLTCEHGGHRVPARWATVFRGRERLLASHRGWDRGALGVARRLARRLACPLHSSEVTRLLADLNRSAPRALSPLVAALPAEERALVLARWHRPYRDRVEAHVAREVAAGRSVLHLSVHTFTPVLCGVRRPLDVGLLYDPARSRERALCARWLAILDEAAPALRVRRNAPYRGTADGLTTRLRGRFPAARYLGVELEINQRHFAPDGTARTAAVAAVERSVQRLVGEVRRGGR